MHPHKQNHRHALRLDRLRRAGQIALSAAGLLSLKGATEERGRLATASSSYSYETPAPDRHVPELPATVEWRDALSRAFLANGEIEAAYFDWKAALARIDQAATWPNSNVAVTFSYMFSSENVKAWDRTTLGVGFDPSMKLTLPD